MPIDDEFRRHLHELMVETNLKLRDEGAKYKSLEALNTCGIEVDATVEREMLLIIRSLTSAAPSLSLPPAVRAPNITAVRQSHAMELSRVGNSLYREAANRLRETKIKARRN